MGELEILTAAGILSSTRGSLTLRPVNGDTPAGSGVGVRTTTRLATGLGVAVAGNVVAVGSGGVGDTVGVPEICMGSALHEDRIRLSPKPNKAIQIDHLRLPSHKDDMTIHTPCRMKPAARPARREGDHKVLLTGTRPQQANLVATGRL